MVRVNFEKKLERLNENLNIMTTLCATQVEDAVRALLERDAELAEKVIAEEKRVNDLESVVEQQSLRLILREQPVASDLRFVSAAMRMNTDLERIGDQAEDIAMLAKHMIAQGYKKKDLGSIRKMSQEAQDMVLNAAKAFINGDSALAEETIQRDDVVDDLFDKVRDEVIQDIRSDSTDPNFVTDVLMIAKYLERIADHAQNIAEAVLYSLTGVMQNDELK